MVTNRMLRRANEVVNANGILRVGRGLYAVWNPEYDTVRTVRVSRNRSGQRIYRSNDWYNTYTGRTSSYITAVKLATGNPV